MTKARLKLVPPAKEKRTVAPGRRPNAELRPREHLTEREVQKLIGAARGNRWGRASAHAQTRYGLRAGEQGDRYEDAASLSRPPFDPIDRPLHRISAWAIQKHLERLIEPQATTAQCL
jgi:hypothetical protein